MKKTLLFWVVLFSITTSLHAQTLKTQTRTSAKIQMWSPDKWAVTAWQNVQYDDNIYIKSKTLSGANLGAIMFFNLGFTIPVGATIQKIEATIIRLKNGRNAVTEQTVALLKALNDTEACGGSPNRASADPWTETEKKMLYSFPATGSDCSNLAFQWTAAEVNKPMFGLLLHTVIGTGGKGSTALIDQVTVTVYYTEQMTTTQGISVRSLKPLNESTSAYLLQNIPNPTSSTTTLRYFIPVGARSAQLMLTNAEAQLVKEISISHRGLGQVNLNTNVLASGTYNYTLYIDGKQMDTKRLLIVR